MRNVNKNVSFISDIYNLMNIGVVVFFFSLIFFSVLFDTQTHPYERYLSHVYRIRSMNLSFATDGSYIGISLKKKTIPHRVTSFEIYVHETSNHR